MYKGNQNRCHFCPKIFCCADCRDKHEDNKHPNSKCLLCVKKDLPYKPININNTAKDKFVLGHIIFNHLPLYCKLCGVKISTSEDLTSLEPCKWWDRNKIYKQEQKENQGEKLQAQPSNNDSPISNAITIENDNVEKKLPLTPQYYTTDVNKSLRDTSSIVHLKQDHLDSPPELVRQTSTPMHGVVTTVNNQKQINTDKIPQFFIKTPSSFDITGSSVGSKGSEYSTRYYTGINDTSARLSIGSVNSSNYNTCENPSTPQEPTWTNSPSYLITKTNRKERSIMKPDTLERRINESSIEKRVRFSDQYMPPSVRLTDETAETSAYEDIFFEAQESLDDNEIHNKNQIVESKTINQTDIHARNGHSSSCCCHKDYSLNSSTVHCNNNNSNVFKNVSVKKEIKSEADSSVDANKSTASNTSSSSSSRVLMMLLVEQTDSKGLSSLDLAPLIDSGLKKLEESVASSNNSNVEKGNHNVNNASLKSSLSSTPKTNSQMISIKDSYVSISDRIECYTSGKVECKKQLQEVDEIKELASSKTDADTTNNTSYSDTYKSDGIFSVVARVVRSALKKLPAVNSVTTRNLSREPLPQNECQAKPINISASSSVSISASEILNIGTTHATASSTSRILLRRSASKRPRDRIDSAEEFYQVPTRDSPGNNSENEVISSPAAKRPRGWYKIKAREPIARMRERQIVTSPRGASRETQRFQQGALTVGDTILPLPSRAHQSTQTED